MDANFWHQRWKKNEIGFHESEGSLLLKRYFDTLPLSENGQGARIFVPLCGKTRDIAWLLNKGLKVVAIELNQQAVEALFEELGVKPNITKQTPFTVFSAPNIVVYVGDFFALQAQHIQPVDAIFDRAALVALPPQLREQYTQHLLAISQHCPQLLITYHYDQALFKGPPFSVPASEVFSHYEQTLVVTPLYTGKIDGGFRGHNDVFESAYVLVPAASAS
ncbi:MAG: thiopurine S-methyltransferase [Glaciecola sp.]